MKFRLLVSLSLFVCVCMFTPVSGFAATQSKDPCIPVSKAPLFVKTYGACRGKPFVYLHGGPGDSSVGFELSTAKLLARQGFYVVVYDRRGEGRSPKTVAKNYSFTKAVSDLHGLLKPLGKRRVTLFGHSFGGIIGLKYLDAHPKANVRLILSGAPVVFHETMRHLLNSYLRDYPRYIAFATKSGNAYMAGMMKRSFGFTKMLKAQMFKKEKPVKGAFTAQRVGFLFVLAMQFKRYTPKVLSKEAQGLYTMLRSQKMGTKNSRVSFVGFIKNENYAELSYLSLLEKHKARVCGLYGAADGLFSKAAMQGIQKTIGEKHLMVMQGAGHFPFLDKRAEFLKNLKKLVK